MYTHQKILKFLSSKLFTIIIILVIALVGLAFYQNFQRQKDINQELTSLKQDIELLEGKKIELARLIEILKSTNYVEKEARLRLGLKKQGEKVISVPENARPKTQVLDQSTALEFKSNPILWFEYFFLPNID